MIAKAGETRGSTTALFEGVTHILVMFHHYFSRKHTLNKDKVAYKLRNIFDQLTLTMPSVRTSQTYKGAVMSGMGCQSDEAVRVE